MFILLNILYHINKLNNIIKESYVFYHFNIIKTKFNIINKELFNKNFATVKLKSYIKIKYFISGNSRVDQV